MAAARMFHWNGKDLPKDLRDLPAGTYVVELVRLDEVPANSDDDLGDEEHAALQHELDMSFEDEDRGQLIDLADAMTDLRTRR